jgi:hypothetical protein
MRCVAISHSFLRSNSICQEGAFDPTDYLHRIALFYNEFVVVFLNPRKGAPMANAFNRFRHTAAVGHHESTWRQNIKHAISDAALQFGL